MKFTARKNYCFYPDINGNLDLPESERLSIEIIRPTAEDYQTLASVEMAPQLHKDDAERCVYRHNAPKILRRHVGEIKNLVIADENDPKKERPITNGEELAAASFAGMFLLVSAICIEVVSDKITDTQKKISESGSGLSGADGTGGNPSPSTKPKK
ncbi:MAG: hypothetical protein LBH44_07705 [Treponema sp.]|jgi:hypothetical protein|nr:hypothetical protein [Treponema sp.]